VETVIERTSVGELLSVRTEVWDSVGDRLNVGVGRRLMVADGSTVVDAVDVAVADDDVVVVNVSDGDLV